MLGRLELTRHTTRTITKREHCTIQAQLRSLLVVFSVFTQFVPIFTRLAGPLNKKIRKDQPKQLGFLDEKENTAAALSERGSHELTSVDVSDN